MATASLPLPAGLCLDCNYELRDLPRPQCPECGRGFDPGDAESYNPGRPIPRWAAWAVGPISWPMYGLAWVAVGVMLWRARLPGVRWSFATPALLEWLAVAAVWAAWPAVRRRVLRRHGWPARVIRPMGRWFWTVPAAVVAMVAATATAVPQAVSYRASRPAMDELAAQVVAHPHDVFPPRRVGLFRAKNIRAIPGGGMRFTVYDDDVAFRSGFQYMPAVDPKKAAWRSLRYVGDGWWAWREG